MERCRTVRKLFTNLRKLFAKVCEQLRTFRSCSIQLRKVRKLSSGGGDETNVCERSLTFVLPPPRRCAHIRKHLSQNPTIPRYLLTSQSAKKGHGSIFSRCSTTAALFSSQKVHPRPAASLANRMQLGSIALIYLHAAFLIKRFTKNSGTDRIHSCIFYFFCFLKKIIHEK